jgi:hypothetical protein
MDFMDCMDTMDRMGGPDSQAKYRNRTGLVENR